MKRTVTTYTKGKVTRKVIETEDPPKDKDDDKGKGKGKGKSSDR